MAIQVGDKLPEATLRRRSPDGIQSLSTGELFAGKRAVVFAVPGAFTPTCNDNHMPGYIQHADAMRAKGVDMIACIAVNDAFVLDAWGKSSGASDKVTLLSDGNAEFTKALGLEMDGSGFGLGTRSKRYSMLVEDGTVKALNVEEVPVEVKVSGAERILDRL